MRSLGINGEELRGQPANPGSPGKMAIKTECVCNFFGTRGMYMSFTFNALNNLVIWKLE